MLQMSEISESEKQYETKNFKASDPFWIARNFNLSKRKPFQWVFKRFFDIIATSAGLILISPLLLTISIIIKLESEGPVIYKNKRTGLYGREFDLYKFRSMRQDAEKDEDAVRKQNNEENAVMYKIDNDPRVTKFGKFIRKYSLDELPQLFNVLKGEMSLVGPRPRASKDLKFYKDWHYLFFGSIPGLTGMWQANGRSMIKDFDTVVRMEHQYLTNWNIWLDFHLLIKTVPVILFGKYTS